MLRTLSPVARMVFLLIVAIGFTGISWRNPHFTTPPHQLDTVPAIDKTMIDGDLDRAIEELNRAKENLERQLQKTDWEKVHRDMSAAFEKIDSKKMQQQMARAMKQIDMQKMQLKAQEAYSKIDWQRMKENMDKAKDAMSEAERISMKKGMQHAMEETKRAMEKMKSVDSKQMHQEMERAMEKIRQQEGRIRLDMEKVRKHTMQNFGEEFHKKMEKAMEKVHRAGEELQAYKEMVNEMEKDGLLNSRQPYTIEYDNEELLINGAKQPAAVTDKYKRYFKSGKVRIKKEKEGNNRTIYL